VTFPGTFDSPSLTAEQDADLDLNQDLVEAIAKINESMEGYDHAKEYDDINLWEDNRLSREGRTLRQSDIEFDPNFCGVVIDAVANKLRITGLTATSGTVQDNAASKAATEALNEVWRLNKLKNYYRVWDRDTCRDGDGYIVVWPEEYADGTDADADTDVDPAELVDDSRAVSVNITYVDPRMGRMFYDPENPRKKRFFAQLWQVSLKGEKKPRLRCNLYYVDRIEKYISKADKRQNSNKRPSEFQRFFDPDHDDDNDYLGADGDYDDNPVMPDDRQWPMPNPWGQIPAFHLRTDLDYGKPVHRNAFGPQDAVSRIIEMQMVTVEFSGYPQRYALQEADSLGTQSIREDPLADHSPADWDHDFSETAFSTTTITAGAISNETGSNYEANPGGMQIFKNFKEVGAFATADPNAFLEPWREYCKAISSTTDTPLYKFQGLGGQVPSGEALKIIEAPLNARVENLHDLLGDTWSEALEFALLCLGYPDARVTVTWANPATTDLMDVWQLVELKVRMGVPRDQAFIQAGVPEQQAQEWAKTYASDFALAQQEQGRAEMYMAQAEAAKWNVVTAKISNGMPQREALISAGNKDTEVDQWLVDQADAFDMTRRIALLSQVSTAAQALGSAVTLGVMNADQVQQIIIGIMGDILPAADVPAISADLGPDMGGDQYGTATAGGYEPDDGQPPDDGVGPDGLTAEDRQAQGQLLATPDSTVTNPAR
jgi:hypothetical protein